MSENQSRMERGARRAIVAAGCLIAVYAILTPPPARAAVTACRDTAKAADHACGFKTKGGYSIALGICVNVSDASARTQCRLDAQDERNAMRDLCGEQFEARGDLCDLLGQAPYDPPINPGDFLSPAATAANPNPYFPLVPGTVQHYAGAGELVTVTVTNQTRVIAGVTTMLVTDVVTDEFAVVIEDTEDYYAQHIDGTVWYFGELARNFENGKLVHLDGSWTAGIDGAKPGIIMEAAPTVGDVYRQEFALANAEDAAEVLNTTATESTPATSCSGTCLLTRDFTPITPSAVEHKYYKPGVGLIVTIDLETGDRVELVP